MFYNENKKGKLRVAIKLLTLSYLPWQEVLFQQSFREMHSATYVKNYIYMKTNRNISGFL